MADNFTPTTFVPQGGESSGESKIPSFLRMLASPVIPQLSDVAGQLRDSALSDMRQAAGPEAATNSAVKKLLYGAKSVGETGLAGAADLGGAMTPSDIVAGGLGPKVAGPYYAARGAVGGIQSAQKAAAEPSPENVQRALQDFGVAFLGAHGAAKAYSGEPTPDQTVNEAQPEPLHSPIHGLAQHAQNVSELANKNGGATYSLAAGDRTGQNQYAVAMLPERNRAVAGKVTPDSVAQYMHDNADILTAHPNANVGVWNNPDTNTHQLEISGTTHDLNNATDVAQRYNQYSIYDLKNGREIPTGGTGDNSDVEGQPVDAASRLAELTPSPDKEYMTLRHYSETPVKDGILSGARRGIGANGSTIRNVGAEGQRVMLGKGGAQGVYFYKDGGQGEPQIVSRPNEYRTEGNYALADLNDNEVFHRTVQEAFQRIKSEESSIPGLSAKQAPISDAEAHLRAINEGEHALQAAGYDGYTNTSPDAHNQHIVFLFGDHKVGPVIPDTPPAPKRVMPASLLTNPQAGATVMPASIIERVLPRSEADRAQSAITKAGGQYQGPWGFEAAGQPEQYAFTDPATGSTLAAGSKELKPALLAEKMAKSRLDMLTSDEKSRLGPRNVKQFSDTLAGLPAVSEMENVAKAGLVGKDWYPNARAAFAQLQRVSPDYFRTGDEIKFANVIGSTSPNQPVEVNIREGLGVWKRWVDAGRPTDAKSVHKLLTNIPMNELTQAGAKVPNLTSSLMGQDLFTGRKSYFKAPSFGEALGGNDESFVGDTHMADAYGLNPAATFKSPRLYYAMAANTRAVARKLNISTSAAQASIWAATVALKNAIGAEPDATPSELANVVTPERIASEMKDMADIMLKDNESRAMIKSMLPKGVSLDAFDEGLKAIVQGRQAGSQRQGTAAARGVEALARRLKGSGKVMRNIAGSFTHDDDTSFDYR